MGAWGVLAFDNDAANDWASGLESVDDLSLVEEALDALGENKDFVDTHTAENALAACEVLARLRGAPGYENAYTEQVDAWVKAHPLRPSSGLIQKATAAMSRILGEYSELLELWQENTEEFQNWVNSVNDLQKRVSK